MKEKMIQIYELMADITIANLKEIKENEAVFVESDAHMVSTILQLYLAIGDNNQPAHSSKEEKKDKEILLNSSQKEILQNTLKKAVESAKSRDGYKFSANVNRRKLFEEIIDKKQVDEPEFSIKAELLLEMVLCEARKRQSETGINPFDWLI